MPETIHTMNDARLRGELLNKQCKRDLTRKSGVELENTIELLNGILSEIKKEVGGLEKDVVEIEELIDWND